MARDQQSRVLQPVTIPQRFIPPTARELRSRAVQRLQVGLFGLAAMLLLIALANIIMDRAREAEAQESSAVTEAVPTAAVEKPAADALADIGVAPAADPTPDPAASSVDPLAGP